MKITTTISYTDNEINAMIDTLTTCSLIIDDENAGSDLAQRAEDAFEQIAKMLCLDPIGERVFHNNGW